MSATPVYKSCHHDLPSDHQRYTEEAQPELTDLPKASEHRLASPIHQLSSVAIYTLAALAAQDFASQALATPVVDFAQNPQMQEAGDRIPSEEAATAQAKRDQVNIAVASPESLNVQEFAPEPVQASDEVAFKELTFSPPASPAFQATTIERNLVSDSFIAVPEPREEKAVVPTLESFAPQTTGSNIAPPETEVMLARTSVQRERSLSTSGLKTGEEMAKEQENSGVQNQDYPQTFSSELRPASGTPLNQQAKDVLAQATPKASCLTCGSTPQTQTENVVAQATPTPCCSSVETLRQAETLQDELRDLENVKVEGGFQASPALSIYIPTGFGADKNTGFVSATYQQRTRYSNVDDGGLGIGIGLGDAQKAVGVELSYTSASFGGSRDFGAGGFNVKVHRQFSNDWAVAAGWNGAINLGGPNDFEQSLYGVVSKVIRTREDINSLFSRVAVTAGIGNGQFRTESAVEKGTNNVNVFGNIAVRVAQPVSLIAEWSGQDLGFGLSVAPFKNIPLVITPAVRDVVGAGDGPRFVLGTGLAFKF